MVGVQQKLGSGGCSGGGGAAGTDPGGNSGVTVTGGAGPVKMGVWES